MNTAGTPIIQVSGYYGAHKEGTKDYTILRLIAETQASGREILALRWGPIGRESGGKIQRVYANQKATTFDTAYGNRILKGYDMRKIIDESVAIADLGKILSPRLLKTLTDADVNWLAEGFSKRDIAGTPQSASAAMGAELAVDAARAREEMRQREEDAERAALRSNPLFGMF